MSSTESRGFIFSRYLQAKMYLDQILMIAVTIDSLLNFGHFILFKNFKLITEKFIILNILEKYYMQQWVGCAQHSEISFITCFKHFTIKFVGIPLGNNPLV